MRCEEGGEVFEFLEVGKMVVTFLGCGRIRTGILLVGCCVSGLLVAASVSGFSVLLSVLRLRLRDSDGAFIVVGFTAS